MSCLYSSLTNPANIIEAKTTKRKKVKSQNRKAQVNLEAMALLSASSAWQSNGPGGGDFGESFCRQGAVSSADPEIAILFVSLGSLIESIEIEVAYR